MSSIKGVQKEMATSVDSLPKPKKTGTMRIYPSISNPQPQTQSNIPKAQIQSEDELRSSEIISSVLLTPPTSPQSSSNLTLSEQKLMESQHPMNASDLKKSLGLDEMRCGCLAQKGRCRNHIRKENKNLINSHIESMLALTRLSPKLEAELNKLFMLIHCRHHGNQNGARIEEWKTAFSIGDADTKPIMSIEKQIIKVFGQLSARCIWISLEGEPCNKSIGGQSVQNCAKTIDEIAKSEVYLKDVYLDYLLKVLETNMYCPDHSDNPHFKKVVLWKSKVIEIRETANSELMPPIESDFQGGFTSQTQVPFTPETGGLSIKKSSKLALPIRGLSTRRNLQSWSSKFNQDPATFWPKAYDTTPFQVIVTGNGLPGYDRVQSKLKQPLGGRDFEDGYVYLYKVEGNERFVKIGWTADSVKVRHDKWAFDCNRNTTTLYPTLESATTVPNAHRVEALCHEELHHCRITISCKGCLKNHTEWFEISPTEAITVIKKWSNWITTRPYQPLQLKPKVKWALKEEEMRRVSDIDWFMNELSVPVTSTVTSELNIKKVGATRS